MFDTYSEQARRTIFFAHHSASRSGAREIGTLDLLLGILSADEDLMARSVPGGAPAFAALIAELAGLSPTIAKETAGHRYLPLNNRAKSALARAAAEAKRRGHKSIEPRHLLWGLLAEGGPETTRLNSHGITLEAANAEFAGSGRGDPDV